MTSEPTEFVWIQLSDGERSVRVETNGESDESDRDEERDDEHDGEFAKRWLWKQTNETKIVEVANTCFATKHEDEKEIDKEHQHTCTLETVCLLL